MFDKKKSYLLRLKACPVSFQIVRLPSFHSITLLPARIKGTHHLSAFPFDLKKLKNLGKGATFTLTETRDNYEVHQRAPEYRFRLTDLPVTCRK